MMLSNRMRENMCSREIRIITRLWIVMVIILLFISQEISNRLSIASLVNIKVTCAGIIL